MVVLHADGRADRARAANFVDRYSGCRSWATTSGTTPYSRGRWSTAWRNDRYVARCSRSPMWWLATTCRPLVTATVLFSSAPTASTAAGGVERQRQRLRRVARASGAAAALRPPAAARATESSQRMWIGRSWVSSPSTIGPRRATASSSSWAIGSSLRLPLVITSGRPTPASSRWCSGLYGSITPSSGSPGRTAVDDACAGPRRGASTIGRRGDVSARRPRRRARTARGRRRGRRPSRRTACRRGPCAGAARRPPPLGGVARRGGSRRCP